MPKWLNISFTAITFLFASSVNLISPFLFSTRLISLPYLSTNDKFFPSTLIFPLLPSLLKNLSYSLLVIILFLMVLFDTLALYVSFKVSTLSEDFFNNDTVPVSLFFLASTITLLSVDKITPVSLFFNPWQSL